MRLFDPIHPGTAFPLRMILIIAVLALATRLVNLAWIHAVGFGHIVEDSTMYTGIAEGLIQFGRFGYVFDGELFPDRERMPLYSLMVAGSLGLSDSLWPLLVFQAALDSLTVMLISVMGWFHSRAASIWAGLFSALGLNMIVLSGQVLTDTVFLFLFTGALVIALYFARRPSWRLGLGLSLTLALATLCRGAIIPLIPIMLAVATFLFFRATRSVSRSAAFLVVCAGTIMVALFPQAQRMHGLTGEYQLTDQGPNHLFGFVVPNVLARTRGVGFDDASAMNATEFSEWRAERDPANGTQDIEDLRIEFALAQLASVGVGRVATIWTTGMAVNLLAPGIVQDQRLREMNANSLADYGGGDLTRIWRYFADGPTIWRVFVATSSISALAFAFLKVVGFVALLRWNWIHGVFAGLIILYFLLLTGPVAGTKYRLPAEPVIALLEAIGFVVLLGAAGRWWRGGPRDTVDPS